MGLSSSRILSGRDVCLFLASEFCACFYESLSVDYFNFETFTFQGCNLGNFRYVALQELVMGFFKPNFSLHLVIVGGITEFILTTVRMGLYK